MIQKICPHCQEPFAPHRCPSGRVEDAHTFGRRKYCSHTCAAQGSKGKKGRGKSKQGRYSAALLAAQQAARQALGRQP